MVGNISLQFWDIKTRHLLYLFYIYTISHRTNPYHDFQTLSVWCCFFSQSNQQQFGFEHLPYMEEFVFKKFVPFCIEWSDILFVFQLCNVMNLLRNLQATVYNIPQINYLCVYDDFSRPCTM